MSWFLFELWHLIRTFLKSINDFRTDYRSSYTYQFGTGMCCKHFRVSSDISDFGKGFIIGFENERSNVGIWSMYSSTDLVCSWLLLHELCLKSWECEGDKNHSQLLPSAALLLSAVLVLHLEIPLEDHDLCLMHYRIILWPGKLAGGDLMISNTLHAHLVSLFNTAVVQIRKQLGDNRYWQEQNAVSYIVLVHSKHVQESFSIYNMPFGVCMCKILNFFCNNCNKLYMSLLWKVFLVSSKLWTYSRSTWGWAFTKTALPQCGIILRLWWYLTKYHFATQVFKIGLHCQWHPAPTNCFSAKIPSVQQGGKFYSTTADNRYTEKPTDKTFYKERGEHAC